MAKNVHQAQGKVLRATHPGNRIVNLRESCSESPRIILTVIRIESQSHRLTGPVVSGLTHYSSTKSLGFTSRLLFRICSQYFNGHRHRYAFAVFPRNFG